MKTKIEELRTKMVEIQQEIEQFAKDYITDENLISPVDRYNQDYNDIIFVNGYYYGERKHCCGQDKDNDLIMRYKYKGADIKGYINGFSNDNYITELEVYIKPDSIYYLTIELQIKSKKR